MHHIHVIFTTAQAVNDPIRGSVAITSVLFHGICENFIGYPDWG